MKFRLASLSKHFTRKFLADSTTRSPLRIARSAILCTAILAATHISLVTPESASASPFGSCGGLDEDSIDDTGEIQLISCAYVACMIETLRDHFYYCAIHGVPGSCGLEYSRWQRWQGIFNANCGPTQIGAD